MTAPHLRTNGSGPGTGTGTGRIRGEIGRRTRRVIYGEPSAADLAAELALIMTVDRAHLVMLVERDLVDRDVARRLLACLDELERDRLRPLHTRPVPRGTYLMYEGYLIERLGPEVGGVLHTGRSRNDLKATTTALQARAWLLRFAQEAIRLEAILLARARAHAATVMPVYTHFQAAMPISYGYYLLGVALALGRDIDALVAAAGGLRTCPLGAGAIAGTDLPIDPARTAALLGFDRPADHALDAVASRDTLLRLAGAAAGVTLTLSRLATDLQLWSTAEFGFVTFPDRLVGGSSAMPQKRNAFLLEYLKAKSGRAIGAWATAAHTMAITPFTNAIEVGTEATAALLTGLETAEHAVLLAQVLVSGARPVEARMVARAEDGFIVATAVANRLVRAGVPFRTAHEQVGEAVRRAVDAGSTRLGPIAAGLEDLAEVMYFHAYGGGPGAFAAPFGRACETWAGHRRWRHDWRATVVDAGSALTRAAGGV